MKALIIRVLFVLFLTSFGTMLFWHYFAHSDAGVRGPRNAKEMAKSRADFAPENSKNRNAAPRVRRVVKKIYIIRKNKAAASNQLNVQQNPAKKDAAAINPHNVQQKALASNNAAANNPNNVQQNGPVNNNAAASNPRNVNLNPANSKDAAAQNPRNVQQNPRNNAAASNPRNVKPNPANIKDAAANNPRNVQQKPAASNNAAGSNPQNVKLNPANIKDGAASNPRNIQQKPPANKDAAASNRRSVKRKPPANNNAAASNARNVKLNPADSKNAAANDPSNIQQKPAAENNAADSNPRNVQENPVNRNNAADSKPRNVQENPVNSNNAADSNPHNVQENPVNSNNAADSNPHNVQENPVNSNNAADSNPHNVQENPVNSNNAADSNPHNVQENPVNSKNPVDSNPKVEEHENINEDDLINLLLVNYTSKWKKHEKNSKTFTSYLSSTCSAITNATVTQGNAPVGTKFTYDGDNKRSMTVTPELFKVFPKENPFQTAPWETCAVVGNGGILANSSCGKEIDAASFVIRCNLPPLNNGHENDTGRKTSLVTANPSIFVEKYSALNEYRRPFLEDMQLYGDALVLLPAFSFRRNTAVCLRALYSLEDYSNNGPRPIIFNPTYLNSLAQFWREQGIQSLRLSTGIMMASLALELCKNVHLYGYWPFGKHPITHQQLTNHYYDNRPVNKRMHAMPDEIKALMNLHNKGVIHLHLENCAN
ncbi:putative uncharacterized protein DDB_G0282133 isoform X2 [Silurus meridionalis]|uniref:putative uncharacterized protein DDB_G0282133 isoform X2 n=1 Tax=Silurus meridionalis TaxID=175797 RepID=UPI001EEB4AA0|nr:putative uncharacterized protein DDB_G0282133 isoform X2 [Silurus meridionalis]